MRAPSGAMPMATKRLVAATRPWRESGVRVWRMLSTVTLLATPKDAKRKLISIRVATDRKPPPCTVEMPSITRLATDAVVSIVRP